MTSQQFNKATQIYKGGLKESGYHEVALSFVLDYTDYVGIKLTQNDIDAITANAEETE